MIAPLLYMFDDRQTGEKRPAFSTRDERRAREANAAGYGAFLAVNRFRGARRAENLIRIRAVHGDIDTGTIAEQEARIARGPRPSRTVGTRRGLQPWLAVRGEMTRDQHAQIERGIVAAYDADPRAVDVCRVLRAPNYFHMKAEPYLCTVVDRADVSYTADELLEAFPAPPLPVVKPAPVRTVTDADDFFEALEALDQRRVLECISGSWLVGGETLEFVRAPRGRHNLVAAGKATSNFIDSAGRIGARSTGARHDGGPLASTWLRFYGSTDREIRAGLIDFVPELRRFAPGERRRAA